MREHRDPQADQMTGQRHADLAEADHHDVVAHGLGLRRQLLQRGGRLAFHPVQEAAPERRDHRGDRHRQRDRDGQHLHGLVGKQAAARSQRHQHEAELAALGEQPGELGGELRG